MNKSKQEHEQDNLLKGNISKVTEPPKIRVIIRKRPLSKKEIEKGEIDIIELRSKASLVVKEQKTKVDMSKYIEEHNFFFDNVFDEDSSNQDIYLEAVRPMITSAFTSKAKVTCFAYGQTGSGKTHTMMGPVSNFSNGQVIVPGLYLLSGYDIFNQLSKEEYKHLQVFISFYEIYCGKLFDLLNDRNMLIAREDGKGNICIGGLSERQAFSLNDLMKVIEIGLRSRTVGVTGANSDSSRSHAIIQISLKSKQKPVGNGSLMTNSRLMSLSNSSNNGVIGSGGYTTHGKITFIDLAGSERAQDISDNNKQTRIDGAEINKSLLALKECIRALDQNKSHTPFRGSKLTMVLRDSFVGGNCKTLMVANISPSLSCSENTLNTLRYADRVKELKKDKETCLLNSNTSITNTQSYTNGIFTSLMSNSKSENINETSHFLGINEGLFDKLNNSCKKEASIEPKNVEENVNHKCSNQNMYIDNMNTNQKQEKIIKSQRIPLKISSKTNLRKTIQDQTKNRLIKNENKENTYFPNIEVIVSNRKEQKEGKKEEGNEEAFDFINKYNYYKTQKNNEKSEKKEGILVKIRNKINEKTIKLEEMLKKNEKSQNEMGKELDELNNKHKEYINTKVSMLKSHMDNVSSIETYLKKMFIKSDSHVNNDIYEYSSIISSNINLINDETKKNEYFINEQSKIKAIVNEILNQNQIIQKEKEEISQLKQELKKEIERFDEKEGKSNRKQNDYNDSNDNIINDFINNEYDLLKKKRDFSMFFDV